MPSSIFCRIRWESNDYGMTRWQLMVMQAWASLEDVQRIRTQYLKQCGAMFQWQADYLECQPPKRVLQPLR